MYREYHQLEMGGGTEPPVQNRLLIDLYFEIMEDCEPMEASIDIISCQVDIDFIFFRVTLFILVNNQSSLPFFGHEKCGVERVVRPSWQRKPFAAVCDLFREFLFPRLPLLFLSS